MESDRKVLAKWWRTGGKVMEEPWENIEKGWKSDGKVFGK